MRQRAPRSRGEAPKRVRRRPGAGGPGGCLRRLGCVREENPARRGEEPARTSRTGAGGCNRRVKRRPLEVGNASFERLWTECRSHLEMKKSAEATGEVS